MTLQAPTSIVYTRFGIGITDESWFESRFRLLQAITLPSLAAQTDQSFFWLIFVGPDPFPWVVDRLKEITASFGSRVHIVKAAKIAESLNEYAIKNIKSSHMTVTLIDDDDAWRRDMVARFRQDASDYIAQGTGAGGFTYQHGYEWIITDLLDISKLMKGQGVLTRKSGLYPYTRPFHSMACFYFCPTGACIEEIGTLHRTYGAALEQYNQPHMIADNEERMWLYVRHHTVNTSIHKAGGGQEDRSDLDVDDLERIFGVDAEKVRKYQADADNIQYAMDHIRGFEDKSQILLTPAQLQDKIREVRQANGKLPEDGGYRFNIERDYNISGHEKLRLCVYDKQKKEFFLLKEIPLNDDYFLPLSDLPDHNDLKFKIQASTDKKWTDIVPYKDLLR